MTFGGYVAEHGTLSLAFFLSITSIWFPVGLTCYHSYLAMSGQTTWEHLRGSRIYYLKIFPDSYHPFDLGIRENLRLFWARMGAPVRIHAEVRSDEAEAEAEADVDAEEARHRYKTDRCKSFGIERSSLLGHICRHGPCPGKWSGTGRPRPELIVWRLPVPPDRATPGDSLFDNRYYSCC